jgi:hypothetical protein
MSETVDSIYPDLLQTGLSRLSRLDERRDLLALFSAIEHFRRELHEQQTPTDILRVTARYISGLRIFRAQGFWLINPADLNFEQQLCVPPSQAERLKQIVDAEIKSGRFATALRQNTEMFFDLGTPEKPEYAALHAMVLSSRSVGMFCGLLGPGKPPNHEISFSLLSLLLGSSADALATLHKTAQLTSQIETLSGMLPLCAWCKKVRNDKGYWEQIEKYISVRSSASFTHGVCPECQKKLLYDIKRTATA